MNTPHPSADLLIAIAQGKQMQIYGTKGAPWADARPDEALYAIYHNAPCRIKPDFVVVNGVECPRPEKETGDGKWVEVSCYARKHRFAFDSWDAAKLVVDALIKPFKESE